MLNIVKKTFEKINNNIAYCHFKSNEHLNDSVIGKTDFDLLVEKGDLEKFEIILLNLGFKKVNSPSFSDYPGVDNWIGFDYDTGKLIHFHVHYELVTGLEGFKNYVLPWRNIAMNSRILNREFNIYTVSYEFELIELYTRMILKQNIISIIKSYLFGFSINDNNLKEYNWLNSRINLDNLKLIIDECYSSQDNKFVMYCLRKHYLNRSDYFRLRKLIKRYLDLFNRNNSNFIYFENLIFIFKNKFLKNKFKISKKTSKKSGMIISFLGVDGSGKSTVSEAITKWLGWKYSVLNISLGIGREKKKNINKIKSSIKKYVNYSNVKAGAKNQKLRTAFNFWRFSKKVNGDIKRINRYRYNGGIVITDRYPQTKFFGISDGPKIFDKFHWLSKLEKRNLNIANIIHPDVIFKLILPVEESVKRRPDNNILLLQQKYDVLQNIKYDKSLIINVDASMNIEDEILFIKREIWKLL